MIAETQQINRESTGADIFMRTLDRIDRSGANSMADDFFGKTLSVYNIDGLHSGCNSPRDSLIQGSGNNMLAMYSGTGRIFSLSF